MKTAATFISALRT